jgi:hypothetical protein
MKPTDIKLDVMLKRLHVALGDHPIAATHDQLNAGH